MRTEHTPRLLPCFTAFPALIALVMLAACCLGAFAAPSPALAATVEIFIPQAEGKNDSERQAKALDKGFVEAVTAEAMTMLPGDATEERRESLRQSLGPKAQNYVISYAETARSVEPEGLRLNLDVKVNREMLRAALRKQGLLEATGRKPIVLILTGATPTEQAVVDDLVRSRGLAEAASADTTLTLEKLPNEVWLATLSTPSGQYQDSSYELTSAWQRVWDAAGANTSAVTAAPGTVLVHVSGFKSFTDARAFEQAMGGWGAGVADRAQLRSLDAGEGGLTGVWSVASPQPQELERQVQAYTGQAGLGYSLTRP